MKCFLDGSSIPEGFCDSVIVLIPKVTRPKHLKNFRPISLCTVLYYKVIAKCLANRLKPLLADIISMNQSAFVPGRLITDNTLVAFECFHFIEQISNPRKNFCAYKIDLSKAYDRVDWEFLDKAMKGLGFTHRWDQLDHVMCILGELLGEIKRNLAGFVTPTRAYDKAIPFRYSCSCL